MSDFLLAGVRVIDAASFIAGPVATTIMADLGADVIKIEPPDGDPYRNRTGGPGVAESPYNYRWIIDNRTKRGLALDLRQPAGQAVVHRLVERADVFVTNTPLDSRARLRIRWEDLAPLNPRLVYASMTAYGERGDEAPRTGFDATALWARTGLMDLVRPSPDSPPARSLPGMGDHPTGVSLFAAIMTALYQRDRTGRGTMVSTSLLANGLWWNATQIQAALCGARVEVRPPREEPATALANLYRCADNRWFLLNVLNDDRDWPQLLKALERPDLGDDPRFATTPARRANARGLVPIFDSIFAKRPWAERRPGADRRSACRRIADRVEPALARGCAQGPPSVSARARRALERDPSRARLRRGGDRRADRLARHRAGQERLRLVVWPWRRRGRASGATSSSPTYPATPRFSRTPSSSTPTA